MFHTRTLNPKSLLLKIVLSLLNPSCHNKFPLQGYNVSGSSTPFPEISQSLGYLWMPTYSLELEEKNTFFTYVSFLQFWRDRIFVRFWGTNTGGLHITLAIPNSFFRENITTLSLRIKQISQSQSIRTLAYLFYTIRPA